MDYGVCVDKSALQVGCSSTEACTDQNGGRAALCRYPGSLCVTLETEDCPLVSGDWQAGDALILGSIGPQTYAQADGSAHPLDHAQRLTQAIDLGVEEWQRQVPQGLFFSQRPIAVVHCNSNGDPAVAQRAMDHLLTDIQVPVVFALTDVDEAAVVNQAVASNVALVCVECYGPQLPPQLEAGLVWRMLPAFEDQAALAAWRVSDLEQRIRAGRAPADTAPVRVALWADSGAGFDAFVDKLRGLLSFNGGQTVEQNGPNYLEIRNVDPRSQSQDQLAVARTVLDFAPDILVAAIDEDFTDYYLRILEAQWASSKPKPQYVATFLSEELSQIDPIAADYADLPGRLSGTGLLEGAGVSRNLAGFQARYRNRYGVDPGRTQGGYDAWYATALAIYSADAGGRLDGGAIAAQFQRLTTGPKTDVDPLALDSALTYLSAQQSIDLVGTSSELDWDPISHRVSADIGLWCLTRDANGALLIDADAGPRSAPDGITGSYDCP